MATANFTAPLNAAEEKEVFRRELRLGASLAEHIGASNAKNPENVLRSLNDNEFDTFEELLEISEEDMLQALSSCGIKVLSANRLKKYCDGYRQNFISGSSAAEEPPIFHRPAAEEVQDNKEIEAKVIETLGDDLAADVQTTLKASEPDVQALLKQLVKEKSRNPKKDSMKLEVDVQRIDRPPLAKGGFGQVHQARLQNDRVALKLVDVTTDMDYEKQQKTRSRFALEAAIMRELDCPRIVRFYGVYAKEPGFLGLVLEFCRLGDLRGLLDDNADLSDEQKLVILMDIAEGMAYIYEKGIEHRDLKAANCLVVQDDDGMYRVKLTDFGLSKSKTIINSFTGRSSANGAAGTETHMAPEVLLNENMLKFTEKSDVYSFGITMWEVLSCKTVWCGLNQAQINANLGQKKRPPIPEGINSELVELMKQCWDGEPFNRPKFETIVSDLRFLRPE